MVRASAQAALNLEACDIRKVYPGTVALDGVSLGFRAGEVHALVGKNGAGKSSLIKILSGATRPTSGRILVRGEEVRLPSPADAFRNGIATVYQELSLVPELTVSQNLLLGRFPVKWAGLCVDWRQVDAKAQSILESLRVDLDVRKKVSGLGMASRQIVEIAKAMASQPQVLMLDEPTSALAQGETKSLFSLIRRLASQGVAIIYISHRLQEIPQIAQRLSVLRDGRLIGTVSIEAATPPVIARMMFGDVVQKMQPPPAPTERKPILETRNLNRREKLFDINLTVCRGEVLGIAGMVGSGRTEVLRALIGADSIDRGEILVDGQRVMHPTPARMKCLGVGLAPENRKEEGLVLNLSLRDNVCLAGLKRWAFYGVVRRKEQCKAVEQTMRDLAIAAPSMEREVASLSGGNQQKAVVGKLLNTEPKVLLFDEPTRGVDIQAKQQIFQIIWGLSREGIACVFVSSELEELLQVCSRVVVMQRGRITAEAAVEGLTIDRLFGLCLESESPAVAVQGK